MTLPRLILHGPPHVVCTDGRRHVLPARAAALLAWLVIEGPVHRSAMAGRLWPDGGDSKARTNLRQLVVRLRRDAGDLLIDEQGVLGLAPDVQVASGTAGELLAGLSFDDTPTIAEWLSARRDATRRQRLREHLGAANAALAQGDHQLAMQHADEALREDPAQEEAHRLRMELFYLRGDIAAAIGAWDDCRLALRQAYGVAPSAYTELLGRQLVSQSALVDQPTARVLPIALRRPAMLSGRESALAQLEVGWSQGRNAVILGPAGVGKSRMVQRLVAPSPASLIVVARSDDVIIPGALLDRLTEAMRERFEPNATDFARGIEGWSLRSPAEYREWMAAWTELWDRSAQRGLRHLQVEDLHYADEISLSALLGLIEHWQHATIAPVQWAMTARGDEMSPGTQILLQRLCKPGVAVLLTLQPLDVKGVQDLLAQPDVAAAVGIDLGHVPSLADQLHAKVGGNPSYLLEALRQVWTPEGVAWRVGDAWPAMPSLLNAVALRLQGLPPDALALAQLAAVAGSDFDADLACNSLDRPLMVLSPAFAALEAAQIFHAGRFAHDLMAEAALLTLPSAMRPSLHRAIGQRLQARSRPAGRIAHHLALAGDNEAAASWWQTAARLARDRWRQADAARLHDRAAQAFADSGDRARAFANWCDAARAWLWIGQPEQALTAIDSAAVLAIEPHEQVMVDARRAAWCLRQRELATLLTISHALVPKIWAAGRKLPVNECAYVLRSLCIALQHGGPQEPVLALCDDAKPRLRDASPDDVGVLATAHGTALHWLGRPREALQVLQGAAELLDERSDPAVRIAVLDQLMRVYHSCGDLSAALSVGEQLSPLARLSDAGVVYECDVLHLRAAMLAAHGRAAESLAMFEGLRDRLKAQGQPMRETFLVSWAHAALAAGQVSIAESLLSEVEREPGGEGFVLYDSALWWARARIRRARAEDYRDCLDALDRLPRLATGPTLHQEVVKAVLRSPAQAELESLLARVRKAGYVALERLASQVAATRALEENRLQDARNHCERFLQLESSIDAWADERASAWLTAIDVLLKVGDRAEARRVQEVATAWIDARTSQWPDAEQRRAWREGHPLHALLLRHDIPAD